MKYTKEQLIEIIKNKQMELGKTPTSYDFHNVSRYSFFKIFGSWNNALKEAGLKPNLEHKKYTKKDLIKIIQDTANKLGRTPTINDIEYPSGTVFTYTFETWNNALKESGLQINQTREYNRISFTKEELMNKLITLINNKNNKNLVRNDIDTNDKMPNTNTIMKFLGITKWNTLLNMIEEYKNYKSRDIDIPSNFFERYIEFEYQNEEDIDIRMLEVLKKELIRLNTTSEKIFNAKKDKYVPSSVTFKRRFNKKWGELLNLIGIKYIKKLG